MTTYLRISNAYLALAGVSETRDRERRAAIKMDNVWVVAPLSLLFCSCPRGFCGLAMCFKTLLAPLLLVLNLSVGVTAQVIAARCLPGWEWVCHPFPSGDAPAGLEPGMFTYPVAEPKFPWSRCLRCGDDTRRELSR